MRWVVVTAILALSACSGESDWVQKCVLSGKTHAPCLCLDKELKPEWRDFTLLRDAERMNAQANMSQEAFVAVSNAEAKCLPAN
jgi:hypothetical protein